MCWWEVRDGDGPVSEPRATPFASQYWPKIARRCSEGETSLSLALRGRPVIGDLGGKLGEAAVRIWWCDDRSGGMLEPIAGSSSIIGVVILVKQGTWNGLLCCVASGRSCKLRGVVSRTESGLCISSDEGSRFFLRSFLMMFMMVVDSLSNELCEGEGEGFVQKLGTKEIMAADTVVVCFLKGQADVCSPTKWRKTKQDTFAAS